MGIKSLAAYTPLTAQAEHITNRVHKAFFLVLMFLSFLTRTRGIEIERFEHLSTRDGLSQDAVLSILCDSKGYIWLGTMDGLNRYDGYAFNIFKSEPGNAYSLTNNRVSKIWEDSRNFIWLTTYDGYVHWFDPARETFNTIPFYYTGEEEKNSSFTSFYQEDKNTVWVGTSNSGIYNMNYDTVNHTYLVKKYLSRGVSSITNNHITFITSDKNGQIWIGTQQGLNKLDAASRTTLPERFEHFQIDRNFSVAAVTDKLLYLGTKAHGLEIYDLEENRFLMLPPALKDLATGEITLLEQITPGYLAIGTRSHGVYIYALSDMTSRHFNLNGESTLHAYVDSYNLIWISTEKFGVTCINPVSGKTLFFQLTPEEIKAQVDDERQYFFEDASGQLWIGLHGAGLAAYDRPSEKFIFYRNDPDDPSTISSNFVHCISQDKSGIIWLGTGQMNGGINKLIPRNPSFRHITPMKAVNDMADNAIRCVFEDSQGNIWASSKSGIIYIYDSLFSQKAVYYDLPLENRSLEGYNIYCSLQDSYGYIWLGSKGGGLAVSTTPVDERTIIPQKIKFRLYRHLPGDTASLSSNNIYSLLEDHQGNIWIGTYGGGLNKVLERTSSRLVCRQINRSNSNLSSNEIRNIYQDSKGRIWVATVFGLNLLEKHDTEHESFRFRIFTNEYMSDSAISYNDIVHIYEDRRKDLWFLTFGGGVNKLVSLKPGYARFSHITTADGLVNNAVFGVLEDNTGDLWFSTESGISHIRTDAGRIENFDRKNGLQTDRFSENTCTRLRNGNLLFGSMNGLLIIDPKKIQHKSYIPPIVFTNFQLFNKDVDIHSSDAPFHLTIEYIDRIVLKHDQSSFSIEYAALSYFDPQKNAYQFRLLGFEESWNDVGNLTRATYTNLPPGKYEFQVKAANWDGTWNPEPRIIKIRIQPPWYKTRLAIVLYILLSLLLANLTRRILINYNHMRRDLMVERKLSDIKLQFFTNISHEIRTPLTLILGPLADIKAHENLPGTLRRSIEMMDFNGKRLLRLVNQLLDFRKVQKNKMSLKIQETEIVQFVREVYDNFQPIAQQKKIHFSFSTSLNSQMVWIDPDQFDSVLFNILSNAFKFTPENKHIELQVRKPDSSTVEVTCRDEGKGIPREKMPVLFQRFTPLSSSTLNYQGTGIGLSLSNEIMKLHKGSIHVQSEVNIGSTFTISLKLGHTHFSRDELASQGVKPEHTYHREAEEIPQPDELCIKQKEASRTILLVEDNKDIADYVRHILEPCYRLIEAVDGSEGMKKLIQDHPDLVITDVMMPVMDGIQMTLSIKENFETSHIPVIMLTAKSQIEDQIHGIESGAEAYILKPFNADYLKAVVSTLLKQRENLLNHIVERTEPLPSSIRITTKDEKFMRDVMAIIEANYSDPEFNVEKLVEKSYVGRTVFYNKVKGLTGNAPVEFLRNVRLKIAANLLAGSGYNVSEVGYMSGFNDIKYFSRCFKALYGLSPSDYKARNARE